MPGRRLHEPQRDRGQEHLRREVRGRELRAEAHRTGHPQVSVECGRGRGVVGVWQVVRRSSREFSFEMEPFPREKLAGWGEGE